MVRRDHGLQCAPQIGGGITFGTPRCDGIAEDLPARLVRPLCSLDGAARFYTADRSKQLMGRNLRYRSSTEARANVFFQVGEHLARMYRRPFWRELRTQRSRHYLKTIFRAFDPRCPLDFSIYGSVNAGCNKFAGRIAIRSCTLQSHVWINAK